MASGKDPIDEILLSAQVMIENQKVSGGAVPTSYTKNDLSFRTFYRHGLKPMAIKDPTG